MGTLGIDRQPPILKKKAKKNPLFSNMNFYILISKELLMESKTAKGCYWRANIKAGRGNRG